MALPPLYVERDLDQPLPWKATLGRVAGVQSHNFATCFDQDQASAAIDLSQDGLEQWIQDHEGKPGTKWIHFWTDPSQRGLVEALASKYDLSPRLVNLLCPQRKVVIQPVQPASPSTRNRGPSLSALRLKIPHVDVEAATGTSSAHSLRERLSDFADVSFGDVVNDLWHFHSIDWSHAYVHIGFNVLVNIPDVEHELDKPAGRRLWTSIVLCHDGTVMSTMERPIYADDISDVEAANKLVKRHILSIFSRISRLAENNSKADVMEIRVRPGVKAAGSTEAKQSQPIGDASLLFYYLFDDWMSTYQLISQRGNSYRHRLEQVRRDLIRAPSVHVLEKLHNIGRQLIVLKSMYQGYAILATRLLTRHRKMWPTESFAQDGTEFTQGVPYENGRVTGSPFAPSHMFSSIQQPGVSPQDSTGDLGLSTSTSVPHISDAALFRFERLLDRINLYALSEINHCLSEKESLAFMTFNLLSLSESHTVEKLTRTTILLAKATIIFLPVSLLTAYFSIQVGDIATKYSLKTYWVSFLIVTVLSVVFLLVFSLVAETEENQVFYRRLRRSKPGGEAVVPTSEKA